VDFTHGTLIRSTTGSCSFCSLLIADRLSKNQRFEGARKWFHYIFDPMAQFTTLEKVLEPQKDPG
jgi:hypothetical protein